MKRPLRLGIPILAAAALFWAGGFFAYKLGAADTNHPPPHPLKVAEGLSLSVFARDVPGARVLALDARGRCWSASPAMAK